MAPRSTSIVTASPAITVTVNANTIAYVSRTVVGTAAQPTIFINYNDQSTGLISLTEAGAGFFQAGTGSNNVLSLCINTGESFTRPPFAVVTAGDLKLLDPTTLGGSTSVRGTLYGSVTGVQLASITSVAAGAIPLFTTTAAHNLSVGETIRISGSNSSPNVDGTYVVATTPTATTFTVTGAPLVTVAGGAFGGVFAVTGSSCVMWTVYSASTVASTIELRGSDASGVVLPTGATNGPRVSVPGGLAPGTTQMAVASGNSTSTLANLGLVSNAVRAFKSGVVVAAVSQPLIPKGSADSLVGNITITETLNGQFKPGQDICVIILPRTSNGLQIQDTILKTATTNDLPIITTNAASGLLASSVAAPGCTGFDSNLALGVVPTLTNSFEFAVSQQSFGTLGQITISNIHVITTADAPNGAVLMDVSGDGDGGAVQFETTISNATIGTAGVADAWIAPGLNVRAASAFSLGTAAVKRGTYVTVRAKSSNAPSGTLGQIWVKTKTTAWHLETSRRVGTDGYLYYSGKVLNLGYRYYKVTFNGGGTSNTVRGFGK